jgi:Tfp pilus assembly protein PilV
VIYPGFHQSKRGQAGFTLAETTIALGVLAVAMTMLAQVGLWCMVERRDCADRQDALELAANVLEAARAVPFDALTPEWAGAQKLPADLQGRLNEGKLTVHVEPEPIQATMPQTRRVTVEITWQKNRHHQSSPVKLVGLFSARATEGGKP